MYVCVVDDFDYGLILTIIKDGTEAWFSGSARAHAFTGKQVNACGT